MLVGVATSTEACREAIRCTERGGTIVLRQSTKSFPLDQLWALCRILGGVSTLLPRTLGVAGGRSWVLRKHCLTVDVLENVVQWVVSLRPPEALLGGAEQISTIRRSNPN